MTCRSGTGDLQRAAGVKTAKLCAEQDQIGKQVFLKKFKKTKSSHDELPGQIA